MSTNGDSLAGNEVGKAGTDTTGAANIVRDLWKPASGSALSTADASSDTKFSFGPTGEATIPPINDPGWKNALSKDVGPPAPAPTSDNQSPTGKDAPEAPKSQEAPKKQDAPKQYEPEMSIWDAIAKSFGKGFSDANTDRQKQHLENAEKNEQDPEVQLKKQAAQIAKYIGDGSLGKNPYQRRVIEDILAKATDGGEEQFNKLVDQVNKDLKERNSPMHLEGKFSETDVNFTYVGKNDVYYPHGKDFKMPSSKLALVDNATGEKQDELNNIIIRNPEDWMASSDPMLRARKMDPIDVGPSHKNVIEPPDFQNPPDVGLPPRQSDVPEEEPVKPISLKPKK